MGSPATMHVSADNDVITSEIYIAATLERVFRAITEPQEVLRWWGQSGVYLCTEFVADLRPGGNWRSSGIGPDGGRFEVTGQYMQIDPPRLLVHSWIANWTGEARTTVRWELEPRDGGTLLRLLHSGLAAHPGIGERYRGWPRMLGWIQALVEGDETVNGRKAS